MQKDKESFGRPKLSLSFWEVLKTLQAFLSFL
jgi:hypothetical protein